MITGVGLIVQERLRQMSDEGFTANHDLLHRPGELAEAGACYALTATNQLMSAALKNYRGERQKVVRLLPGSGLPRAMWPFGKDWWKPSDDPIRNLVKAGALIAAEIDRIQNPGAGK